MNPKFSIGAVLSGLVVAVYSLPALAADGRVPGDALWGSLSSWAGGDAAAVGAMGLFVLTVFYAAVWLTVGNKRQRARVEYRHAPPTDLPPAALRYVSRMGYDDHALVTAITSMAAKGYLYVEEKDRSLSLIRDEAPDHVLSYEEAVLAAELFQDKSKVTLSWSNRRLLTRLKRLLRSSLSARYRKGYFRRNTAWGIVGLLISSLAMFGLFAFHFTQAPQSGAARSLVDLFLGAGLAAFFPFMLWRERGRLFVGHKAAWPITMICAGGLAVILGLAMAHDALTSLRQMGFLFETAVIAGVFLVNGLVLPRLPAYSNRAWRVVDEVAGFRAALSSDNPDYFAIEDGPRMFEVFLPYAIAVDEGAAWAARLADGYDAVPRADHVHATYAPVWYSGPKWNRLTPRAFVVALTGALSAAVDSESAPASQEAGERRARESHGEFINDPPAKHRDHTS